MPGSARSRAICCSNAATEKSRVRLSTPMAIGRASIAGFSISAAEQKQRQIVDGFVAHILQRLQRRDCGRRRTGR